MDSQNEHTSIPFMMEHAGAEFHHQHLSDLSLIHEKFIDFWFKHINYFNSHYGQLPAEILAFIDGLSFVECCFLQHELSIMADIVAHYSADALHQPKDFYTEEYDMNAQVNAYMNYIDQRLATLHQLQGLLREEALVPDFSIYLKNEAVV